MNKRGISPLIATMLLISFAVALGVVVMNFGRAQVELEAQCPIDIGLKFAEIAGKEQICQSNKDISFTLENGPNIKIAGFVVSVIGSERAQTFEINEELTKAGTYLGKVNYDRSVNGEVRQIKISPKINLYDEEQICVEKALIAETLNNC